MKSNVTCDERVVLVKRKIQSDGFSLIWLLLLISILVQQFVFSAPVQQYLAEMVIFLAMSVYIIVANLIKGNDLQLSNSKKSNVLIVLRSVIAGLVVAVINTVQNHYQYGDAVQDSIAKHTAWVAIISFLCTAIGTFIVLKIIALINIAVQNKINTKLEDDQ